MNAMYNKKVIEESGKNISKNYIKSKKKERNIYFKNNKNIMEFHVETYLWKISKKAYPDIKGLYEEYLQNELMNYGTTL